MIHEFSHASPLRTIFCVLQGMHGRKEVMLCLTWVLIQGGSWDRAEGGEGPADGWRTCGGRRLHGAQREHDGNFPQGWDIRVTPNPLSENAHSLWEAGVRRGTVERGTKRVNKGEEESVMKHIPGVISLGGEDRNFLLGVPPATHAQTHTLQLPSGT